jgi:hypothetical protein
VSALAFSIVALMAVALFAYLGARELRGLARRRPRRERARRRAPVDPGRERRAERRARSLLKSIVNPEEWQMYRDLGFIRVLGDHAEGGSHSAGYGYLIYPHKPIVAYLPGSNSLLNEYCVEFPDPEESLYGPRLPDSDDVLAKWMMIRADEHRLIRDANMHLPGRQVDPQQVRRDLWRLGEWERARARQRTGTADHARERSEPSAA